MKKQLLSFSQFFKESNALLKMSLPIIITQLATQAMGFADTTMAGQVGPNDLAAIALGASLWVPVSLILRGLIMALTPTVAHHRGAQSLQKIPNAVVQMIWLALFASIVLITYLYSSEGILNSIGVTPALIPITGDYLLALSFGVPGIALFYIFNGFCEGMGNTRGPMLVSLIGLAINIPINYILIYGKFGFPAMGAVGCGWATSIVYWLMSLMMWAFVKRHAYYSTILHFTSLKPVASKMKKLLSLGLPIGLNIAICGSIFAVIALLIGRIGAENVAAAQIALNVSGMTYMIPMSLSFGITIRVGHALGAKRHVEAVQRSVFGIITAALLSLVSISCLVLFPEQIVRLYTADPSITQTAIGLLMLSAIYQFSDALQTSTNGALRGYKDTKVPMILAVLCYWGLALPLGVSLGLTDTFVPAMSEQGFWIGIVTGLSAAAIAMIVRLVYVVRSNENAPSAIPLTEAHA